MRSVDILSLWFLVCCFFLVYELQNTGAYRVEWVGKIHKSDVGKGHVIIIENTEGRTPDILVFGNGNSFFLTNYAKNFEPRKTISLPQLNLGITSHIFHLAVTELLPGKKFIALLTDSFDLALLNTQGELIWSTPLPGFQTSSQMSQFPPEEVGITGTSVPIFKGSLISVS